MAKSSKRKSVAKASGVLPQSILKRNKRASFMLNEKEKEAIDIYCKKHKIRNKSKFMRDTLMRTVMDHFLEDYPTLFDKKDMDKIKI